MAKFVLNKRIKAALMKSGMTNVGAVGVIRALTMSGYPIVDTELPRAPVRKNPINRWGHSVRKGSWVSASNARGDGVITGRVARIVQDPGAPYAVLDNGQSVLLDDIAQALGPMKIGRGGVVKQNPLDPVVRRDFEPRVSMPFAMQMSVHPGDWAEVAAYVDADDAMIAARDFAKRYPTAAIRVVDKSGARKSK